MEEFEAFKAEVYYKKVRENCDDCWLNGVCGPDSECWETGYWVEFSNFADLPDMQAQSDHMGPFRTAEGAAEWARTIVDDVRILDR